MKNMIATLLLLATLVVASAEHAVASKASGPAISLFRRLMPRHLQELSEQCINDTAIIANTTASQTAYAAWDAENDANLQGCATVTTTEDCTLDSSTYATHNANVAACTESGGVNYFYNTTFDCSVTIDSVDSDMSITFDNFVTCIAPSCNLTSVEGEGYASITFAASRMYQERLLTITDSAVCTSDYDCNFGLCEETTWPTYSPTADGGTDGTDGGAFSGVNQATSDSTLLAPFLSLNGLVVAMTSAAVVLQCLL